MLNKQVLKKSAEKTVDSPNGLCYHALSPVTNLLIFSLETKDSLMEEPAKASLYVDCGCCGKATFIDLLDASMVCEYCAEVRRTRSHYLPKKGARNNKGRRSRDNR